MAAVALLAVLARHALGHAFGCEAVSESRVLAERRHPRGDRRSTMSVRFGPRCASCVMPLGRCIARGRCRLLRQTAQDYLLGTTTRDKS